MNLKVNEVFGPTIQGEGPSQGKRVMFLRLATCNLSCIWCDTPYTWNWIGTKFAHPSKYDKTKEVKEMDNDIILEKLKSDCKAVVISGGEPLLQQNSLLNLLGGLKKHDCWIEVETNGTIAPGRVFTELVDQINCSPKLSNSGDSETRRIKQQSLEALSLLSKTFFKFVISCERDVEEVLGYVERFKMNPKHVYLMPLGKTKEELQKTAGLTRALAKSHSFIFSSRLHVELWGNQRAV